MVRGTSSLERYASVIALWLLLACEALAQNPSFKSFDTNDFVAFPPSIRLRNVPSQQGTNTYITNLYVLQEFVTNLTVFETNFVNNSITTNLYVTEQSFVTQEFVTNLTAIYNYNTYLVTSNLTAGNVVGTLNTLAIFTPDGFSLGDSIVTQPNGNTIQVNGTNSGAITLNDTGIGVPAVAWGLTNTIYKSGSSLIYSNTADASAPVSFGVQRANGDYVLYGVDQVGRAAVYAPAGKNVRLGPNNDTPDYFFTSAAFYASGAVGTLGTGTNYWGGVLIGTNAVYSPLGTPDGVTLTWGGSGLRSSGITKVQKTALAPVNGTIVYQTDNTPGLRCYIGGNWFILSTGADP